MRATFWPPLVTEIDTTDGFTRSTMSAKLNGARAWIGDDVLGVTVAHDRLKQSRVRPAVKDLR